MSGALLGAGNLRPQEEDQNKGEVPLTALAPVASGPSSSGEGKGQCFLIPGGCLAEVVCPDDGPGGVSITCCCTRDTVIGVMGS